VLGVKGTKTVHRRLIGIAITMALLVGGAFSGCGSDEPGGGPGVSILRVTERDFKITAPKRVRAGNFDLLARNRGPDDHELIVVREGGTPLPFRTDGITIDEDALESVQAGALEPFGTATVGELHLHLTPGRYIMFCNMAGHYLGGMHTTLVVR
jgi:uncharacterized cupredoxin-like copper-binding protein